jgi:hypothetical protein
LLDWLACEFSARGWSLKAMHRLMVTSAAYRQSSRWSERGGKLDPDNRLLWHMNRRRLEGEALRDAMLAVRGQLNTKMDGPSVFPELPADMLKSGDASWPLTKEDDERNRRSVYVFVKRNLRYPFFSVFDSPNRTETCARRNVSTNAPQALFLLNDRTTLEQARAFAGRVLCDVGTQPRAVMERAYRLALGRSPDREEVQHLKHFLAAERERLAARVGSANPPSAPAGAPAEIDPAFAAAVVDLCHALLNVNEFLYVD